HQITKSSLNKISADELKKNPISQGQLTLYQSLEIIKPHSKMQMQKLNNSLLRFIINSVQPLSIVEDEDFIKYSYDLDPKYKLPCRQVLKDKIDEVYYDKITEIQQRINEANYISMTLDLWSSAAHTSYLGVTLHWVTNDFIPSEILLTIKEIPYPHTAVIIKEEIEKLINKYQLESKLSHTLQLSIINRIKEIDHLVTKCKNLIRFLSQDKKQQLREAQLYLINQQKDNNNKLDDDEEYIILNVVKANNTRWNSVYYAFERLIILKPAIITLKETLLQDIKAIEIQKFINNDLALCWNYPNDIGIYASFFDLRFKDLEFLTQESKFQTIDEIKKEYENVTKNLIPQNL
ncbi:37004_t:CDS:2, partial [Gigaspora margarita]